MFFRGASNLSRLNLDNKLNLETPFPSGGEVDYISVFWLDDVSMTGVAGIHLVKREGAGDSAFSNDQKIIFPPRLIRICPFAETGLVRGFTGRCRVSG